jgi:hypothetical protein
MVKVISIDGVDYVKKDDICKDATKLDGLEYVLIRADRAGVFAGYLESQNGQEVILRQARRLWRWYGANSLSELAMDGVSKPSDCLFPKEVTRIKIQGVIETIPCTEKAQKSIFGVKEWKQ